MFWTILKFLQVLKNVGIFVYLLSRFLVFRIQILMDPPSFLRIQHAETKFLEQNSYWQPKWKFAGELSIRYRSYLWLEVPVLRTFRIHWTYNYIISGNTTSSPGTCGLPVCGRGP